MYWENNWNAVMSVMNEASEHGAPAYLLTVRGSVHISQSDFSIMYKHVASLALKATVHPLRAIDLNISASLEFLRLVIPDTGGGKSIINRCMTDEKILEIPVLDKMPDDHRPSDTWIGARLRIPHELRRRVASGLQRKFKRKVRGGTGTEHATGDEMWCHYKPTDEELNKWIEEEGRGEKRINEEHTTTDIDSGSADDDTKPDSEVNSWSNAHEERSSQSDDRTATEDKRNAALTET